MPHIVFDAGPRPWAAPIGLIPKSIQLSPSTARPARDRSTLAYGHLTVDNALFEGIDSTRLPVPRLNSERKARAGCLPWIWRREGVLETP